MADDRIEITLEDKDVVEFVRGKVRSGEFASEADVVRESIEAIRLEDAERHRWEQETLLPAHDHLMTDAASAIPYEEVQHSLEAKRWERLKAS